MILLNKFLAFMTDNDGVKYLVVIPLLSGVIVYALVLTVLTVAIDQREESRNLNDFCYSKGMVKVQTDAGPRCVEPNNLVRPK